MATGLREHLLKTFGHHVKTSKFLPLQILDLDVHRFSLQPIRDMMMQPLVAPNSHRHVSNYNQTQLNTMMRDTRYYVHWLLDMPWVNGPPHQFTAALWIHTIHTIHAGCTPRYGCFLAWWRSPFAETHTHTSSSGWRPWEAIGYHINLSLSMFVLMLQSLRCKKGYKKKTQFLSFFRVATQPAIR